MIEFEVYGLGICCASVCTSLPIADAEARLNSVQPTGIDSKWEFSKNKFFANSKVINGCDCPDHVGNKHYLFNC